MQALFKGKPASTAYAEAGYSPHDGNCIRLRGNERVQARLSELQAEAAKSAEVTVASLLGELEGARVRATSLNQLGAVVKSISEKAKISGLLTTKIEITDNSGGTMDDWIDSMLYGPGSPGEQFRPFDQKDRQGLVDLVQRAASDIGEYLAALKARPIAAERVDLKKLPTDWQSLKPYSAVPVSVPRRIGNGRR